MLTPISRKLTGIVVAAAMLCAVDVAPAIPMDPPQSQGEVATINVVCGRDTIADALEQFPHKALVIVVNGSCLEDVRIERSRVTLVAAKPRVDGVIGQADGGAAVTVAGAGNVIMDGLRLRSGPGSSAAAVFVTGNGDAALMNVLIDQAGDGIQANHGGFLRLQASEIRDVRGYGLLLTDGAVARIENSVVAITNSDLSGSAAIGAFRSVNLRLRGNNRIANSGDDGVPGNGDDGFSLDLFHNVEIRQDGGHTVFIGQIELGNLSHGSLRDPEIVGPIDLFTKSRLEIRNASVDVNEVTGNRRLRVLGNSQLDLFPGMTAEVGFVEVRERSAFHLWENSDVSAAGHVNLDASSVKLDSNSSLDISQNLFIGRAGIAMDTGSRIFVAGELAAFTRVDIDAFGPNTILEVVGPMAASGFVNINIGQQSTLTVHDGMHLADFSLMFAGPFARINTDLNFGGSVSKVNFVGDGVVYSGNMLFSAESSMTFGPNNVVDGSINCNGGRFFEVTPLTLTPGSFTTNCLP